ncbi:hypothetical protein [Herbidospora daliensis]|uniref:hypothetical protein n=1 Tax=Herbidospora daliensis TaxID=295585 RepID=UPI000784B63E|nr:hypothetical protein [Herbidospora daliensis]
MTFELALWYEPEPISKEEARDRYRKVRIPEDVSRSLAAALPGGTVDGALVSGPDEAVDEVGNAAFEFAREHGLVCYDARRHLIHNREPLGAYREVQLHTGDGVNALDPDLNLVNDVLETLSAENPFMALVVYGHHFIQVSPGYEVDFKEEGVIRSTSTTDKEQVRRMVLLYLVGDRSFLDAHEWTVRG